MQGQTHQQLKEFRKYKGGKKKLINGAFVHSKNIYVTPLNHEININTSFLLMSLEILCYLIVFQVAMIISIVEN
jgi:hypothetical protein